MFKFLSSHRKYIYSRFHQRQTFIVFSSLKYKINIDVYVDIHLLYTDLIYLLYTALISCVFALL